MLLCNNMHINKECYKNYYEIINEIKSSEIPLKASKELIDEHIAQVFLKKLNIDKIDIFNNNYADNPQFQKYNNKLIFDDYEPISWAWWIEKYIVKQKRLEEIYGPYSLKVTRQLTDDEKKKLNFFNYIIQMESKEKDSCDDNNYSNMHIPEEIRKYFYRNESTRLGLVKRLANLGYDIEQFSKDPDNYDNYLRLLYFFYNFEKKNKMEITPFFKSLSIENEDSRYNIVSTQNGKYIGEIKENLSFALPAKVTLNINYNFFQWNVSGKM